jgi:hypothetical protein
MEARHRASTAGASRLLAHHVGQSAIQRHAPSRGPRVVGIRAQAAAAYCARSRAVDSRLASLRRRPRAVIDESREGASTSSIASAPPTASIASRAPRRGRRSAGPAVAARRRSAVVAPVEQRAERAMPRQRGARPRVSTATRRRAGRRSARRRAHRRSRRELQGSGSPSRRAQIAAHGAGVVRGRRSADCRARSTHEQPHRLVALQIESSRRRPPGAARSRSKRGCP